MHRPHRYDAPHQRIPRKLAHYAHLARISYETPHVSQQGRLHVSHSQRSELLFTKHAGKIWVWHCDDRVIIVIRGSHEMSEWLCDVHMVNLTANLSNSFFERMAEYERNIEAIILDRRHNIGRRIVFVGHSWGATVAESMSAMLMHKPWSEGCRFSVYSFDSPGQPEVFRRAHGIEKRMMKIHTLNSVPNVVNMLHRPCAGHFYSCSHGSRISPQIIVALLQEFRNSPIQAIRNNINEHTMTQIIAYLDRGDISEDDVNSWPQLSNGAVTTLGTVVNFVVDYVNTRVGRANPDAAA